MPEPGVFRHHLQQRLPAYMIPQYFVELDAIPLLASGKVDRRALANASTEVRKARVTVPPRNEREAVIHRVWASVLANDRFGVHDSFFDLGGHSLLAVRAAARITAELGLPCALPMLFRYPTVAALAAALPLVGAAHDRSLVTLQPRGDGPALFCISGVEHYQALADQLAPTFPVHALFTPLEASYWSASRDTELPSVRDLAADYVQVMRAHQTAGPYLLAGFSFGGVIAYEMAQQLLAAGEDVPLLVILDSDPPRSAEKSPPGARSSYFRPIRNSTRALLGLAQRIGASARLHDGAADTNDVFQLRRERYLGAMHQYLADPYNGVALLIESAEEPAFDPGYGWDALIRELTVCRLSSTHVGILRPGQLDAWIPQLRALLAALPA
jgi:thioesterase domain-containing protein